MSYGDYDGPDKWDKGCENGSCNRRACQDSPAIYYNHWTLKWYCKSCAIDIGQDPFVLSDWVKFGKPFPMFETREMINTRAQLAAREDDNG